MVSTRLLMGLVELAADRHGSQLFSQAPQEPLPAPENIKGTTILLRYLNILVEGPTEALYNDVFGWVDTTDSAWNDHVGEIIEKDTGCIKATASRRLHQSPQSTKNRFRTECSRSVFLQYLRLPQWQ
jgi:hypothetical protein